MSLKSSQPKVNKIGDYLKFPMLRVWFHCGSLTETVGFFVSAGPRYSDSASISISSSSSSLIHCDYYELVNATKLKLPTRAAEFPVFEYLARVSVISLIRFLLPYQCSSVSMLT